MSVLTHTTLKEALRAFLGPEGMNGEEASELAEYLLGFFGYGTEIADNLLESNDRDVFYMLEERGLLSTRQEEVMLAPGKLWRLHYWVLRLDRVQDALNGAEEEGEGYETLYESLPVEIWARRAA